jgi:hypothetical protein
MLELVIRTLTEDKILLQIVVVLVAIVQMEIFNCKEVCKSQQQQAQIEDSRKQAIKANSHLISQWEALLAQGTIVLQIKEV